MDARNIEPRTALWAVAEVSWEEQGGTPRRAPATLEDTSPSGACIRLKTAITIGSRLTVKWHREQFSAVARNCRRDGREFLLGVHREAFVSRTTFVHASVPDDPKPPAPSQLVSINPAPTDSLAPVNIAVPLVQPEASQDNPALVFSTPPIGAAQFSQPPDISSPPPVACSQSLPGSSPGPERPVMQSKQFFPKFWRSRQSTTDSPVKVATTEAPVNKSHAHPAEGITGPQTDLLSYEDIYHAAGILSTCSGYGVHKVVEMLNSDRIRELSKDIKRASVLMALDAAGTSPDSLLKDATHRQQALNSYEAGQQKQLEEFEARKAREDGQIQAEMDRLTAHYAERLKQNHDQVAREKEVLRNWQMAKQHELQRIAEVIELCDKQQATVPRSEPSSSNSTISASPAASEPLQSLLAAKATSGR
jgi:hypothetical protein